MKKILTAVLCLMLLASCAAAETAGKTRMATLNVDNVFTIQGVIPEGYLLVPEQSDPGRYLATIVPAGETAGHVSIVLSIAYDELMSEVERMNDLDADALAKIEATFLEEDSVEISYRETAFGTKVMAVKILNDEGGVAAVDFYTIYKGFGVEIFMLPAVMTDPASDAEETVTEEQIAMAIAFLSDMDFVPAE